MSRRHTSPQSGGPAEHLASTEILLAVHHQLIGMLSCASVCVNWQRKGADSAQCACISCYAVKDW